MDALGVLSSIARIADLAHGAGEFALFKAYIDESGIHRDSNVCIVAGFIAPLAVCVPLEGEWRGILRKFDLEYFHAKDFSKDSGQFMGWKHERRQQFLDQAFEVIEQEFRLGCARHHRPMTLAAAVHTADFRKRSIDERRWLTGGVLGKHPSKLKWKSMGAPTKPYFLGLQQCVMDAIRFGMHNVPDKLHFVFDRQNEYKHSALSLCEALRSQHRDISRKMGDIVFSGKESAVLLQVADFMAYEAYQFKVRVLLGTKPQFLSRLFDTFYAGRRLVTINAQQIEALLELCPIQPGNRFRWPDEFPERLTGIPMGTKVVRFPRQ